jgi:hypothetical protein
MKKVILNRRKRSTTSSMKKNTHTITDIEGLINDKLYIMQNGATMADKKKARTEVIRLSRMLQDISNKEIETKKYPERKVPPKTTKKELLALIDSVTVPEMTPVEKDICYSQAIQNLDLSGGSPIPGENRFRFVEKGW